MNRHEFIAIIVDEIVEALRVEFKFQLDVCTKTCVNCESFDTNTEICGLYSSRPPAETIIKGCVNHTSKEVINENKN